MEKNKNKRNAKDNFSTRMKINSKGSMAMKEEIQNNIKGKPMGKNK